MYQTNSIWSCSVSADNSFFSEYFCMSRYLDNSFCILSQNFSEEASILLTTIVPNTWREGCGFVLQFIFRNDSFFVTWYSLSIPTSIFLAEVLKWEFMLVMEPTELVCPSGTFQNDTKWLALHLKGGGLSLRMVGLEVSSAFCLLYSKRALIPLSLGVSYCDCENCGNQAWSFWMTMPSCLNMNLAGVDEDIFL